MLLGAVAPGWWPSLGITRSLLDVQILRPNHSRSAELGANMVGLSNLWGFVFFKFVCIYFYRGGRERGREGDTHWCERETSISCILYGPQVGTSLHPRHVP